jgi:hypothetical protein
VPYRRLERHDGGLVVIRWPLVAGLVRPVSGVLGDAGTKHRPQMGFALDEHPVGALGPDGPYPAFGITVRSGCPGRGLYNPHALAGRDMIERAGELRVEGTTGLTLRLGRGGGGVGRRRAGGRWRVGHLRSGLPGGQQRAAAAVPAMTLTVGTRGRWPCFIPDDTARQMARHCFWEFRDGIPGP